MLIVTCRKKPHARGWNQSCCAYTDLNSLRYDSFKGQGQLLWFGICLNDNVGMAIKLGVHLVSMVSTNLGIWFYEVEMSDRDETMECEESL